MLYNAKEKIYGLSHFTFIQRSSNEHVQVRYWISHSGHGGKEQHGTNHQGGTVTSEMVPYETDHLFRDGIKD